MRNYFGGLWIVILLVLIGSVSCEDHVAKAAEGVIKVNEKVQETLQRIKENHEELSRSLKDRVGVGKLDGITTTQSRETAQRRLDKAKAALHNHGTLDKASDAYAQVQAFLQNIRKHGDKLKEHLKQQEL